MPNERYVKISMRDRWERVPYDESGDPAFAWLNCNDEGFPDTSLPPTVSIEDIFSTQEIVHLVNRALYAMKYQKETHANRRLTKSKTKEETK